MSWGFTEKYQFLGGVGVQENPIFRGGLPKKGKRGGSVLERGGWYPNAHYAIFIIFYLI